MAIPVLIQHGNHTLRTQMHAVPRAGDRVRCSFPASGIESLLFLQVEDVIFQQPQITFEGKECPDVFNVIVTTGEDSDPRAKQANAAIFKKLLGGA